MAVHGPRGCRTRSTRDPRLPPPLSPGPGPQPPSRPPTSVNVTRSPSPPTRLSSCDSSCASPRRHAAVTRMASGFRYRPGPSQGAKAAWPPPAARSKSAPVRRHAPAHREQQWDTAVSPRWVIASSEIRVARYCGITEMGESVSADGDRRALSIVTETTRKGQIPLRQTIRSPPRQSRQIAYYLRRRAARARLGRKALSIMTEMPRKGQTAEPSARRHKIDPKIRSHPRRRGAGVPRRGSALHPGFPPAAGAGPGPWLAGAREASAASWRIPPPSLWPIRPRQPQKTAEFVWCVKKCWGVKEGYRHLW